MVLPNSSTFDDYGNVKFDYTPIVDPTTDRSANEINTAMADLSCLTRTTMRAWLQFNAYDGYTNPIIAHDAVWGNSSAVLPTVTRVSTGVYTLTWPATVFSPQNTSINVNLRAGFASLEGTTPALITVSRASPNSFTVRLFTTSSTPSDLSAALVNVWVF